MERKRKGEKEEKEDDGFATSKTLILHRQKSVFHNDSTSSCHVLTPPPPPILSTVAMSSCSSVTGRGFIIANFPGPLNAPNICRGCFFRPHNKRRPRVNLLAADISVAAPRPLSLLTLGSLLIVRDEACARFASFIFTCVGLCGCCMCLGVSVQHRMCRGCG